MEDGVTFGWKAEYLKFMARTALINGEPQLATKYLNMLKQTLFHKKWAEKYAVYAAHPEAVKYVNGDLRCYCRKEKKPGKVAIITGGGTGIIDSESAYRYPIVANHFYAFGDEDHPIDLKGNGADLTITVDPAWKGEENLGITEGTTEN